MSPFPTPHHSSWRMRVTRGPSQNRPKMFPSLDYAWTFEWIAHIFLFINIFFLAAFNYKISGYVGPRFTWARAHSSKHSILVCQFVRYPTPMELQSWRWLLAFNFRKHSHSDRNYMEFPKNKIIQLYNCFFFFFFLLFFCCCYFLLCFCFILLVLRIELEPN